MPYLRWDDHSAHVMSLVSKLYKNLELADCTLDTDGGLVYGHRALLGACSPYLKNLIVDHQGMEIIQMKEVKLKDMKHILDFVYFGEVDVSVTDLPSLIETAQLLQIPSLSEFSIAFSEKSCLTRLCDESVTDSVAKCTVNGTKYDGDLSVEDSVADTGNALNELTQTHMQIAFNNSVPNSIVSKLDMANEETENLQDDWTPFAFVAVSPCSVKSERSDDEHDDAACGPPLEVENPLEAKKPVNADSAREITREREVPSGLEIKKEIEEVVPVNESNDVYEAMGMNCVFRGQGDNRLTDSENICVKKSTQNVRIVETEGCVSLKSGFAEGMEDLQMEFEAVGDILKCELSEVKPLEIKSDNEAMDDSNRLLTSDEVLVPFNCETLATPLINIRSDVNQASDEPKTQRTEANDLTKVFSEGLLHSSSKMHMDNNDSASQEWSTPMRTSSNATAQEYKLERRSKELLDDSIQSDINRSEIQCGDFEPPLRGNGSVDNEANSTRKKRHKRIDTGIKPFLCDDCGASFSTNGSFRRHKLIHSGMKPFKCDDCGTTFSQGGSLLRHKRIHTGIKPFRCDDCGETFLQKYSLERHKRSNTGFKPFKCYLCGVTCSEKCVLRKHMLTHIRV